MNDRYRSARSQRSGGGGSAPRRQWNSWDDQNDWDDAEDGADGAKRDGWDQPTIRRNPSRSPASRSNSTSRNGRRADDERSRPQSRARYDDRDNGRGGRERDDGRSPPRSRAPYGASRPAAGTGGDASRNGSRPGAYRASSRPGAARAAPQRARWTDTVERWGETSRQWVVSQAQRFFTSQRRSVAGRGGARSDSQKPSQKTNRVVMLVVILFVLACPLLGGIQLGVVYLQARSGLQHFKNAQADLAGLSSHPFDANAIAQMRAEFSGAYADFGGASAGVHRIPGLLGATPIVGSKLAGAQRLLPIAAEAAQAGMLACDAFAALAPKMKNPFDASGAGITADDLKVVSATFAQIKPIVDQILGQVSALQPSDLTLDARLGPMVASVQAKLPEIKQVMTDLQATLAIAGSLLGVGQPANYLLEVLDSTELRPGGGFIGNYGFVTLNGGHLTAIKMQDVDLLDANVKYGTQVIPIPSQYSWFSTFSRWGFRDSNLDADFPTSAKNGEQLYKQEAGSKATATVGVIAITPWLIRDALKITGAITLPEYGGLQVTADNLVDKIHYYQLTDGVPGGPDTVYDPQCGSSARKCFTGYLFKHFMETVKTQAAQDMGPLMKVIGDGLHGKDVQIYLDAAPAEDMLVQTHLGSTIEAPATGDSFFAVDANIIANKANYVITSALSDQVTIDEKGNASHHTTLTYTWPKDPKTLNETYPAPASHADRLVQYQRIYVPPNAKLTKRTGWYATDSGTAFTRQVWGGKMVVSYGTTTALTVDWTDANVATHDAAGWHYRYLLQKQSGVTYALDLKIALPACAQVAVPPSGFKATDAHTLTLAPEPFTSDTNVALDYAGC